MPMFKHPDAGYPRKGEKHEKRRFPFEDARAAAAAKTETVGMVYQPLVYGTGRCAPLELQRPVGDI